MRQLTVKRKSNFVGGAVLMSVLLDDKELGMIPNGGEGTWTIDEEAHKLKVEMVSTHGKPGEIKIPAGDADMRYEATANALTFKLALRRIV